MSGATSLDTKGKRKSLSPKDCVVATPEEFVTLELKLKGDIQ